MAEPIIPGKKPSEVPSKAYTELDSEALIPVSDVESGVRKDATLKVMQLAPKSHLTNPNAHTDIRIQMKPFDFNFGTGNVEALIAEIELERRLRVKDLANKQWDIIQCTTETADREIVKIQLTGLNGYPNPTLARFEFTYEDGHWLKSQEECEIVKEAPADHKQYARKDKDWVEVESDASFEVLDPSAVTFAEVREKYFAGDKMLAFQRESGYGLVYILSVNKEVLDDVYYIRAVRFRNPSNRLDRVVFTGSGETLVSDVEAEVTHYIIDAPSDDKMYARKNGDWEEVTGGGDTPEIGELVYGTSTFDEAVNAIAQYKAIRITLSSDSGVIVTGHSTTPDTVKFASVKHDGTVNLYTVDSGDNWTETPIAASDVFIATYGITSTVEIKEAVDAGKIVVAVKETDTVKTFFTLDACNINYAFFRGKDDTGTNSVKVTVRINNWSQTVEHFANYSEGAHNPTSETTGEIYRNTTDGSCWFNKGGDEWVKLITLADVPKEVFVATVGVTTYAEIAAAWDADKLLMCDIPGSGGVHYLGLCSGRMVYGGIPGFVFDVIGAGQIMDASIDAESGTWHTNTINYPQVHSESTSLIERNGDIKISGGKAYIYTGTGWQEVSKSDIAYVTYGTTTFDELDAAVEAGKHIVFMDDVDSYLAAHMFVQRDEHGTKTYFFYWSMPNGTTFKAYIDGETKEWHDTLLGSYPNVYSLISSAPQKKGDIAVTSDKRVFVAVGTVSPNDWKELAQGGDEPTEEVVVVDYPDGDAWSVANEGFMTDKVVMVRDLTEVEQKHLVLVKKNNATGELTFGDGKETYVLSSTGHWSKVEGDICNLFIATYEETTFEEMKAAYDMGKAIFISIEDKGSPVPVSVQLYETEDPADNDWFDITIEANGIVANVVLDEDGWRDPEETQLVAEAPQDGKQYARKNSAWEEVAGGASVGEVTFNVSTYAEVVAALESNDLVMLKTPDDSKLIVVTHYVGEDLHTLHLKVMGDRSQGDAQVTQENEWTLDVTPFTEEAPGDGKTYGRKNGAWEEVAGGASVGEVTFNVSTYAEVVAAFENNDFVKLVLAEDESSLVEGYGAGDDYVNMLVVVIGGYVLFKVTSDNSWTAEDVNFTPEAPEDGEQYAREDGEWHKVKAGDVYSGVITYGETTATEAEAIMDGAFLARRFPVISGIPGISSNNNVVLALSISGGGNAQYLNCLVLPDHTYPELKVITVKVDESTNEWSTVGSNDYAADLNSVERESGKAYVRTVNAFGNPVWAEASGGEAPVMMLDMDNTSGSDYTAARAAITAGKVVFAYQHSDAHTLWHVVYMDASAIHFAEFEYEGGECKMYFRDLGPSGWSAEQEKSLTEYKDVEPIVDKLYNYDTCSIVFDTNGHSDDYEIANFRGMMPPTIKGHNSERMDGLDVAWTLHFSHVENQSGDPERGPWEVQAVYLRPDRLEMVNINFNAKWNDDGELVTTGWLADFRSLQTTRNPPTFMPPAPGLVAFGDDAIWMSSSNVDWIQIGE